MSCAGTEILILVSVKKMDMSLFPHNLSHEQKKENLKAWRLCGPELTLVNVKMQQQQPNIMLGSHAMTSFQPAIFM